jgi:hypothetical protein
LDSAVFLLASSFVDQPEPQQPPTNGIPAPGTLLLAGLGLAGLGALRRRKR